MSRIACEICGSSDFVKQDNMFVCQSCGMKYTAEEVKKLRRRVTEVIYPGEAQLRIEELDLSLRSYNCLRRAGIQTVEDLLSHTPEEIDGIRNLGKKSQAEIRGRLAAYAVSCAEHTAEHPLAESWKRVPAG